MIELGMTEPQLRPGVVRELDEGRAPAVLSRPMPGELAEGAGRSGPPVEGLGLARVAHAPRL
jgi:hypothetical protein